MRKQLIAGLLVLLAAGAVTGQTKYKVTATAAKHTDFTRLKTHVWEPGWTAFDPAAHEQIVAAVDRELTSLGFTKGTPETCNVTVSYASIRRSDVNLKAHAPEGKRPMYPVASLVVLLREPGTHKELFKVRADTPISLDAENIATSIDTQVSEMFAKYPTRHPH